jgi:hypothetical protein
MPNARAGLSPTVTNKGLDASAAPLMLSALYGINSGNKEANYVSLAAQGDFEQGRD